MGAILIREVMAGIVFAICFACGLHRLVGCLSDQAWIIGYQAVCTQPEEPARLFFCY